MTATELVAKLAETHGVSKAQAKSIVDDIMKNILDAAASGAEVSLPGFGKFKVKATPTFFINGHRHDGSYDLQTLMVAITEAALLA